MSTRTIFQIAATATIVGLTGCAALAPASDDAIGTLVRYEPRLTLKPTSSNLASSILTALPGGSYAGKVAGGVIGDAAIGAAKPEQRYTADTAPFCDADVKLPDGREIRVQSQCSVIHNGKLEPGSEVVVRTFRSSGEMWLVPRSMARVN